MTKRLILIVLLIVVFIAGNLIALQIMGDTRETTSPVIILIITYTIIGFISGFICNLSVSSMKAKIIIGVIALILIASLVLPAFGLLRLYYFVIYTHSCYFISLVTGALLSVLCRKTAQDEN